MSDPNLRDPLAALYRELDDIKQTRPDKGDLAKSQTDLLEKLETLLKAHREDIRREAEQAWTLQRHSLEQLIPEVMERRDAERETARVKAMQEVGNVIGPDGVARPYTHPARKFISNNLVPLILAVGVIAIARPEWFPSAISWMLRLAAFG